MANDCSISLSHSCSLSRSCCSYVTRLLDERQHDSTPSKRNQRKFVSFTFKPNNVCTLCVCLCTLYINLGNYMCLYVFHSFIRSFALLLCYSLFLVSKHQPLKTKNLRYQTKHKRFSIIWLSSSEITTLNK